MDVCQTTGCDTVLHAFRLGDWGEIYIWPGGQLWTTELYAFSIVRLPLDFLAQVQDFRCRVAIFRRDARPVILKGIVQSEDRLNRLWGCAGPFLPRPSPSFYPRYLYAPGK